MLLITGASGMIGTSLCEELIKLGIDFLGLDKVHNQWNSEVDKKTAIIDLLNDNQVNYFIEGLKGQNIDLIIHLAANARVIPVVKNTALGVHNCMMTNQVYWIARELGIKRIFFASSREVYGNELLSAKGDLRESFAKHTDCSNQYAASKIYGEALANAYHITDGIDTIIGRFSNVYGQYDMSDRFVPLMIKKLLKNEDITIYGGKEKSMDFTFISDTVNGIIILCKDFDKFKMQEKESGIYNISSGKTSSLFSAAEYLKKELRSKSKIILEENRKGEPMFYCANIIKAKSIGYEPKIELHDGLNKSLIYYKKQYASQ